MAPRPLVVLIAAVPLLSSCSEPPAPVEMPAPSVVVHTVGRQPLDIQREFIGRTDAPERVELRARVAGILQARAFEEGSHVDSGALLFEIEPDTYAARVAQAAAETDSARAQLQDAEVRLKRFEQLGVNRNISEQDVDEARSAALMARAGVEASEAALQQAELDLERTRIDSPIDGRIGESRVDVGNLVGPDSGVLATVMRLDPIHVRFTLSDVEYLEYRRRLAEQGTAEAPDGIVPTLRLSDGRDYPHRGRLELIGNEVDPGTGTLTVRAVFPNPDELLRPGQFVTVILEAADERSAITVPQAAVLTGQAGQSVMVVGDDNVVEQRSIETGARIGDMWVVTSGLEEGERVVVSGLQRVSAGVAVNVVDG